LMPCRMTTPFIIEEFFNVGSLCERLMTLL